jgi:DNA mismatch repair protein MutS
MEKTYERVKNFNVQVKEINNKVVFLRKLTPGGSEHSFGIHVAKMAGMPRSIVERATKILKQLEKEHSNSDKENLKNIDSPADGYQLSIFQLDDPVLKSVRDEIVNTDIDNLTPIEALNKLYEIKKIVTGKENK